MVKEICCLFIICTCVEVNVQAPIHIIQNKNVYSVNGSYNHQTNMYNYKEIKFTW